MLGDGGGQSSCSPRFGAPQARAGPARWPAGKAGGVAFLCSLRRPWPFFVRLNTPSVRWRGPVETVGEMAQKVEVKTSMGSFVVELYHQHAPKVRGGDCQG